MLAYGLFAIGGRSLPFGTRDRSSPDLPDAYAKSRISDRGELSPMPAEPGVSIVHIDQGVVGATVRGPGTVG
jgi:hypothetical protein